MTLPSLRFCKIQRKLNPDSKGLAYLKSRKALFPPPDPLTWDTPNMSLNFRDYIYNSVYNYTDTKATILAAMNAAAMISPQTVFPPGTYRWEVGVTTLDCFIGTHGSRGYSTYGEWMESLNAMSLFNRNYKMISFAVDLYVRRTDTQGRTRLYEQGDCYLVV